MADESTVPAAGATAGQEPTFAGGPPPPLASAPPPASTPVAASPPPPPPQKWAGRAGVPTRGPTPASGTTARFPPVLATPAAVARRRPSAGRRFLTGLLASLLILAVPVVSAYVAYKLTLGENPFEWPPTMDLSRVF